MLSIKKNHYNQRLLRLAVIAAIVAFSIFSSLLLTSGKTHAAALSCNPYKNVGSVATGGNGNATYVVQLRYDECSGQNYAYVTFNAYNGNISGYVEVDRLSGPDGGSAWNSTSCGTHTYGTSSCTGAYLYSPNNSARACFHDYNGPDYACTSYY